MLGWSCSASNQRRQRYTNAAFLPNHVHACPAQHWSPPLSRHVHLCRVWHVTLQECQERSQPNIFKGGWYWQYDSFPVPA